MSRLHTSALAAVICSVAAVSTPAAFGSQRLPNHPCKPRQHFVIKADATNMTCAHVWALLPGITHQVESHWPVTQFPLPYRHSKPYNCAATHTSYVERSERPVKEELRGEGHGPVNEYTGEEIVQETVAEQVFNCHRGDEFFGLVTEID